MNFTAERKPVILISGDAGCGKDEAAACFASHGPFTYKCSTSYVALKKMWAMKESPRPYNTIDHMYQDRDNHRKWWADWIDNYNQHSPSNAQLYLDAIEEGNTILTGVRKTVEFVALARLNIVDLIIWIDRPGIPRDRTQEYGSELADVVIKNDRDITTFQHRCQMLAKCLFPLEKPIEKIT